MRRLGRSIASQYCFHIGTEYSGCGFPVRVSDVRLSLLEIGSFADNSTATKADRDFDSIFTFSRLDEVMGIEARGHRMIAMGDVAQKLNRLLSFTYSCDFFVIEGFSFAGRPIFFIGDSQSGLRALVVESGASHERHLVGCANEVDIWLEAGRRRIVRLGP